MDFTPIYLLLGVVLFWFIVFVLSLQFFRSSLRVPTEAELELAQEHGHPHGTSSGVEERARASSAH